MGTMVMSEAYESGLDRGYARANYADNVSGGLPVARPLRIDYPRFTGDQWNEFIDGWDQGVANYVAARDMPVMCEILADGIAWEDSDGSTVWTEREALALADDLETRRGYVTEVKYFD